MWMIALITLISAVYCLLYMAYCIRNKNILAVAGSIFLTLLPIAAYVICVLARVGAM